MEHAAEGASKEEGLRLLKVGHIDEAIKVFEDVLKAGTDDAQVHMYLGVAYGRKNDKLRAIHHLETSTSIEETPKALYNLGLMYESAHRVDEAVRQYKMAAELDPTYTLAQDALEKLQAQFSSAQIQSPPMPETEQSAASGQASTTPATQVAPPPQAPPDFAAIRAQRQMKEEQEIADLHHRLMKAGLIYGMICGSFFITLCYLASSMYLMFVSFTGIVAAVIGGAIYGGLIGLWIGTTSGGDGAGMQAGAVLGAVGGLVIGLIYGAGISTLFVMAGLGIMGGITGMFIGRLVDMSIAQV